MPHNLAGWLSYLKQVTPGMEMTGWLVLVASVLLFVLLIPYSWRWTMRHHDEALEREQAASLSEDTEDDAVGAKDGDEREAHSAVVTAIAESEVRR